MRTEYKEVSWRSLKPGDIIKEYRYGNTHAFGKWEVVELNVARIGLRSLYGENNPVNYYSTDDFTYMIPYTDEEMRERYHQGASEVIEKLRNSVPYDVIGYHEMYNAWVGCDAYEFAQSIKNERIDIIGVCYEVPTKDTAFDMFDVGIVAEDETGERFWCHYKNDWLKDLFEDWENGKH